MTEVQNFMLTICSGCTIGFLFGSVSMMIVDGIRYVKEKRRKKKQEKAE